MNWTPEWLDKLRLRIGRRRGEAFPAITKTELSKMLDCRPATISAWYRGKSPSPQYQVLLAKLWQ